MHVVATAGHVDHGKSTLVRALTGTDPDRLAEEKERGLTIDLGFAGTELPSGRHLAIIDVPGHIRFLKNMLAGLGAIDACLFVVAASEGWKPQSEEHLRILDVLGVGHGIVVLTKVGLIDDDLRELARLEVEEAVEGTLPSMSCCRRRRRPQTSADLDCGSTGRSPPPAPEPSSPGRWPAVR
ncbi:MAG: GTP-binding protein [Acidimicrobiales bacterium]|nr:GTP-binding protein [Acidimicrobiales bacterium]